MSDVKVKFGAEDVGLEKTLKSIQGELGTLKSKISAGDLSMTELEKTMKRVGQVESLEKRLKGMASEAAQTSPKMDALGKDLKQMADKAADAGDKGGISFGKLAAASAAGGLAVAAFTKVMSLAMDGVRAVAEKFGEALDMGGRLNDLKARTGETAGNLLILERAFDNAGTSAENVGPAINKLQRFMDDAANGGKKQTEAMERLGISMDDLQGKTPIEQMKVFADKIAAIKEPTERTAMAVAAFGKNGGELLPFLRNFSGEIDNAKSELGGLPKIMDESSEKFDTIGDKLNIVKGKFTEFAVGIIDRVLPALELFTVSFAKIDAAGLGQKLANAFIGGRDAMQGFTAALDAISIGDFSSAFKIAFMSIELQIKQTANEIWKNMQAAFSASAEFLGTVLGPSSGAYFAIKLTFENIGKMISISIGEGIAGAVSGLGPLGDKLATGIRENVEIMRRSMDINSDMISVAMGRIGDDLKEAGQKFPDSFKDAYNKANPLFDVTQDTKNLAAEIDKVSQKKIISDEANKSLSTAGDEFLSLQNAINPLTDNFDTLEGGTDDATSSLSELNQALFSVPTLDLKVEGEPKIKALIALSDQLAESLEKFQKENDIDPGGKLKKKFEEQKEAGKNKAAESTLRKIENREKEQELRGFGPEKDRRHVRDIAKAEGVDTFSKEDPQIRQDIINKRNAEKQRKAEREQEAEDAHAKKRQDELKPGKQGEKDNQPAKQESALSGVLGEIKGLVDSINGKLPLHALGY